MGIQPAAAALRRPSTCTEFQVHVDAGPDVIDFTLRRLQLCVQLARDPRQKLALAALVQDYVDGNLAVAWRRGRPVPLRLAAAA